MRRGGRARLAAAALVALALALRLGDVAATPRYEPRNDDRDYLAHAAAIARSGVYPRPEVWIRRTGCPPVPGFPGAPCVAPAHAPGAELVARPTAYRPPAYPYLLAGVQTVGGWLGLGAVIAGRIFQAMLGTLLVALIGLLARRVGGRRVALIALGLAAIDLPLILVGGTLISETLFVTLALGALCAALVHRERRGGWRWLVLAGVLTGLAALTRTNGLVLLLPVALLARSPRWLASTAVLVGCALLTVAPWTVRNAVLLGHFVPVSTETGGTLVGTYNPTSYAERRPPANWLVLSAIPRYSVLNAEQRALPEVAVDGRLRADALSFAAEHPAYVPEVLGWNTLRLLDLTGARRVRFGAATIGVPGGAAVVGSHLFHILLALALVGALLPAARRAPRALWLAPLLIYLSAAIVTSETPRFRAGLEPFFVLLAAVALEGIVARLGPGHRGRVKPPPVSPESRATDRQVVARPAGEDAGTRGRASAR